MAGDPYSLDRLQDIIQPDAVRWWPPAPFWYCLIAIASVWLLHWLVVTMIRWVRRAYRRQAVRELDSLSDTSLTSGLGLDDRARITTTEVASILKRVALVSYPREEVAGLAGDAWLRFLTKTCDGVDFTSKPTRSIGSVSYDPQVVCGSDDDQKQILDDARKWIVNHRAEANG